MSLLSSPRTLLAVAAVAIGALLVPVVSSASGPVITERDDTTPQSIIEWADCPGFVIDATYMADRRSESWYDAQGNLLLERRHISYSGTLYNDTDPSKALPYEGHFDLIFDNVAGTVRNTGLVGHVIVPGQGVINATAGLFVGTDSGFVQHGPNGDVTQLCAALA